MNKVAIVTGGTRGIGLGITKELLSRGYDVAVCCRHQDQIDECLSYFKDDEHIFGIPCDVSKEEDWGNMVNTIIKKWKRIDVLVNNAGILLEKPLMETSYDEIEQVLHINYFGAFLGIKAVVPHMKKERKGSIINISSIAGLKGFEGLTAYCSSKFAIIGLTKVAALELAKDNIRVNAVCPGLISTDMTKDMIENKDVYEGFIKQIPLARAGQPEEIGSVVGMLADEESSYVTGSSFVVDGGFTI